jgi:hypothetical protein
VLRLVALHAAEARLLLSVRIPAADRAPPSSPSAQSTVSGPGQTYPQRPIASSSASPPEGRPIFWLASSAST